MTKEEEARLEAIARAKIKKRLRGINGFFHALWAWPNHIGYHDAYSLAYVTLINAGADRTTASKIAERVAVSFAQPK